jgi:hypothetical protein
MQFRICRVVGSTTAYYNMRYSIPADLDWSGS